MSNQEMADQINLLLAERNARTQEVVDAILAEIKKRILCS